MTISRYIQQDMRVRIESGTTLPYTLTLADIASYYKVSPTPVRAATQALIREGLLLKLPNRRLAINYLARANGSDETDDPVQVPLPPPNWRQVITTDIVHRSLRGESGYLREEAMAATYGVSRTVIRQAFSQLAGKGMLEHVPRSGWRIRRFDQDDMEAYLVVRETLELKALELAQDRLDPEDLKPMLAGNPVPQLGDPVQLDNRIHQYLVDKADNFYIKDFFDRHGVYYMMLFELAALEASVAGEMAAQHRELITALIEKDWPRARTALAHHIRSQKPVMRKLLELLSAEQTDKFKTADSQDQSNLAAYLQPK